TDFFQHDGSVLNILDADYSFLNEDLAKHYGIPDSVFQSSRCEQAPIETQDSKPETLATSAAAAPEDHAGSHSPGVASSNGGWRRVDGIKKYSRGGILGQATTLTKQSGASRTSPILRGNWVCEVLL